MAISNEKKGIFAIIILSIIYGVAGLTARHLQGYFSTWQQLAAQGWIAWFIVFSINHFKPKQHKQRITYHEIFALFNRALIGRIISSYYFIQACVHAPLGNVGWISALPTSALFGWWLFGQHISRREWLLLAAGITGVGLMVSPDIAIGKALGKGEVYALISVFATGLAFFFGRTAVNKHGTVSATSWVLFFSSLLASAFAIIIDGGLKLPPVASLPVLLTVSALVILSSACSLFGFTYVRASTATAILSLEAVWSVGVGIIFYTELPTIHSLIGGTIIVVSAYFMAPRKTKIRKQPKASNEVISLIKLNQPCGCRS